MDGSWRRTSLLPVDSGQLHDAYSAGSFVQSEQLLVFAGMIVVLTWVVTFWMCECPFLFGVTTFTLAGGGGGGEVLVFRECAARLASSCASFTTAARATWRNRCSCVASCSCSLTALSSATALALASSYCCPANSAAYLARRSRFSLSLTCISAFFSLFLASFRASSAARLSLAASSSARRACLTCAMAWSSAWLFCL